MTRVAVLFAKGGMGDVGKMVLHHACNRADLNVRGLGREPEKVNVSASVTKFDPAGKDNLELVKVDAASDLATLTTALQDVDAVVSCIGCRQIGFERWAAPGTANVIAAMKANNVNRLVMISSVGIRESYPPLRWAPLYGSIFRFLMLTLIRSAVRDLTAAEEAVVESGLDYLIVRPTGLTPELTAKGKWKTIVEPSKGKVDYQIAKEDVAQFMLEEALQPSIHREARTVGWPIDD